MQSNTTTPDYGLLYDIIAKLMGIRRLKLETIPDDYVRKIPEAGRWGANSQPWEVIVVKDEGVKRDLSEAYRDVNSDFIFWMEQMRERALRHPAYHVEGDNPKQQWERARIGMARAWCAGAYRYPYRLAPPMGYGPGRAQLRGPPESPHGRARQCRDVNALGGDLPSALDRSTCTSQFISRSRPNACSWFPISSCCIPCAGGPAGRGAATSRAATRSRTSCTTTTMT
jgi:hypothetical protein